MLLGGERHCEGKVSRPRTQHSVPGEAPRSASASERTNHEANACCLTLAEIIFRVCFSIIPKIYYKNRQSCEVVKNFCPVYSISLRYRVMIEY